MKCVATLYFVFLYWCCFMFRYVLPISGLEILIDKDERFRNYKNDLFSHRSKELDRELMGIEQNNQLNISIASYLKLLSGYFLLRPALKTLEYLIRRHKWVLYYLISIFYGCLNRVLWTVFFLEVLCWYHILPLPLLPSFGDF